MTQHQARPPDGGAGTHGRHHRNAPTSAVRGKRAAIVVALVVAVVGAAGAVTWFVRSNSTTGTSAGIANAAATSVPPGTSRTSGGNASSAPAPGASASAGASRADVGCPLPGGTLTVAAAPDIAGVIADLTGSAGGAGLADGCAVTVTGVDAADFIAGGGSGAGVWIPDSSMWIAQAQAAGIGAPNQGASIATSPVVLALSAAAAGPLTAGGAPDVARILASRTTPGPVRVGLPDPSKSAPAIATILVTRSAVTGTADARAALTWAVRSSPPGLPIHDGDLLDRLGADPGTAVPVSEQSLVSHNASAATPATAVYLGPAGAVLDYPMLVLSAELDTTTAADQLMTLLLGSAGRAALLTAGFRAPDGTPPPTMTADNGVDPALRLTAPLPSGQVVSDAIHTVQVTNEPSRMLAVMDISGSMQSVVPGTGGATRLDLAKEAAARGLGLYGPDSDIGLWAFSRTLTPDSDHQELIPVSTLGPDGQGGSGAQRLGQALAGLQAVPDGGTGLYDTVLDAVRSMRASFDPTRVNTVLVLTDGMNDDLGSISLDGLLSTLTAEQDPNRPVPVISIAFGPDSDVQALSQISKATGGASYQSQDPRQIGEIFLDAVGQRLCRPSC